MNRAAFICSFGSSVSPHPQLSLGIKLQLKRSRVEIVYTHTHTTQIHIWNGIDAACETRIRLCSFRCNGQHPDQPEKKQPTDERAKSVKVIYIHFLKRCRFMRTKHDDAKKCIHRESPMDSHMAIGIADSLAKGMDVLKGNVNDVAGSACEEGGGLLERATFN